MHIHATAGLNPMPALIVIALRLVLPLTILRWPLAGGLLAMAVDALDVVLVDAIAGALGQPGEFGPFYAQLDKWIDIYYLSLELVVVRRWPESLPRSAAILLFVWRFAGVVAFEVTAHRPLLLIFPNLFENFFIYVLVARRWFPSFMPRTVPQLLAVLVALLIPKIIQEWVLHREELHPRQWLRDQVIGPVIGR
jgi:hypothetical protein